MMFELFHYDSIRDVLVIENPIVLEIGSFKKIWNREWKVGKNGNPKEVNKKELMYIFFMANWTKKNPYRADSEKVKDQKAREACDFQTKWEPDQIVMQAIEDYKELVLNSTPTLLFLVQLEQTILQTADQLRLIKEQNEILLRSLTSGDGSIESVVNAKDVMIALRLNLQMMFAMTDDVEKANRKRKDLEKQLKDDLESSAKITGGRTLSNRELRYKETKQ